MLWEQKITSQEADKFFYVLFIDKIHRHEILSLKVPNVEFDFDVTVCNCTLSTDTSKSNLTPYNSMQMSIRCKVLM